MPARITVWALLPDCLCSAGIGFFVSWLRCLMPLGKRRWFGCWADFFSVGTVLILLQGYAASRAAAGELRWYLSCAALMGAWAAQRVFAKPLQRLRTAGCRWLRWVFRWPSKVVRTIFCRSLAQKNKKRQITVQKNQKKLLQNEQKVLYNSNVS